MKRDKSTKIQIGLEGRETYPWQHYAINMSFVKADIINGELVLERADRVFVPNPDKEKERMRNKINKFNLHIDEQTVELKKKINCYEQTTFPGRNSIRSDNYSLH